MVGEDVEAERAPAPPGDQSHGSDIVELRAATYEKLRRLAAEYLRSERAGHTPATDSPAARSVLTRTQAPGSILAQRNARRRVRRAC